MAFVTDVNALFLGAYARQCETRAQLGFPALCPDIPASYQIGAEFLEQEQVAPRIVIVPTRAEYDFSQPMPGAPSPTNVSQVPRKSIYRRWLHFEAHIWSDPDISGALIPYFDFNTALELEREFIRAMYLEATGGSFVPTGAEWRQPNNVNRYGRVYVLSFKIATQVTSEPYVILPYSVTHGDGGVVRELTTIEGNVTVGPIEIPE